LPVTTGPAAVAVPVFKIIIIIEIINILSLVITGILNLNKNGIKKKGKKFKTGIKIKIKNSLKE
jgi:hypothetical protein